MKPSNTHSIGPLECEISLEKILRRINNKKMTNKVMSRYIRFRECLDKAIEYTSQDQNYCIYLVDIVKYDHFDKLDWQRKFMVPEAWTHLRCCMVARYREALRKARGNVGNSGEV